MEARTPSRGWYTDPFERHRYRFWDGQAWTGYAADEEVQWDDVEPYNSQLDESDDAADLFGIVAAVAGYFVGVGLAFLVHTVLSTLNDPGGRLVAVAAGQLGLWTGLVGTCVFVSRRRGTGSLRNDFGIRFRRLDIGFGLAGAFAGRIVAALVVAPLPIPFRNPSAPERGVFDRIADRPIDWLMLVLIVCVGAPVIEELFFRGLMQPRMVKWLGTVKGVVATAALFGAAHLTNWQGSATFVYVISIAGAGLVLGLMRHVTGRLGPSTWAHFFFNGQAVALSALLNR